MEFDKQLISYIDMTTDYLEKAVPIEENHQKVIYEAMRYSLLAGGKRIRPVIALGVCEMLGGNIEYALPFAAALECIHTYSLIHDDLPCMDDDGLRRGRPTCHVAYDESTALLAGDALLNRAFEIMTSAQIEPNIIVDIVKTVSGLSGTEGMIGGQVVDLDSEGKKIDYDKLSYIHKLKTGALIKAAALIGAICAKATQTEKDKIIEYAENLGLAFQIKDDILDHIGDEKLLGKPTGSDEENDKNTFVTLMGIDDATRELERTTLAAKAALSIFGEKNRFLIALADFLLERNY